MKTISEIRQLLHTIKTETRRFFNTGARVDEFGQDILDHIQHLYNTGGGGATSHPQLQDKNAETTFQHIDTTTTKETLVEADKVPIYDSVTGKVVLTNKSNIKARYLQNVTANTFVADITYEDFPFKCEIAITGVTSANNAEITFSLAQATSGDLAPICVTDTNKVIIYAKRDLGSIVIPLIKMEVVLW